MKRVLIIDDELAMPGNAAMFSREHALEGFKYQFCGSLEEAVQLQYWDYSLVLLDIRFEGKGSSHGVQILRRIRERAPRLPVVMLSSRTDPEILIRCWDAGAQAYIVKWSSNPRFHNDLAEKLRRYSMYRPAQPIVGESPPIAALRQTVQTLASYDISVLVEGETGTGKELVARALHEQGKRAGGPFVVVNAGAIPGPLIESEMFGHVKGAFTGATERRGKVEEADGGTLFLDEIADLAAETQVKLLRLLDTGEFVRVGENRAQRADIRVVAATNKHLEALVRKGAFREDLFFRLNGFNVRVPPLREHIEDLPLLAEHFLELFKNAHPEKSHVASFASDCMKHLQSYHWPGNVRELRNVIERAIILTTGKAAKSTSLPPAVLGISEPARTGASSHTTGSAELPDEKDQWPRERVLAEVRLCVEAKRRIQEYKGTQWKAEFMRVMYPECKAANAKGLEDLLRRLTKGPWGCLEWRDDQRLSELLRALHQ